MHLLIRIHGRFQRDRRERLLLMGGLCAHDFAARPDDADPVDRQLLGAARVGKALLPPRFRPVLVQNLDDLAVGAAAAAVGLEPHDTVVEQVDVVVVRILGGIYGQLVDRVALDRWIPRGGDAGSLRAQRACNEREPRGENETTHRPASNREVREPEATQPLCVPQGRWFGRGRGIRAGPDGGR